MIMLRTMVTTPIYCYLLKMNDCMLTITGLLVTVGGSIVMGTATKGWMLYYGAAIGILGALDSTPIRSLVSKMVEPTEFGKLFTFLSTAQGLTSLMTSSGFQEIYAKTITTYPGAMYLVSAGLSAIAVVKVYLISVLYEIIHSYIFFVPLFRLSHQFSTV